LDGGYSSADKFLRGFLFSEEKQTQLFLDSKTMLQEFVQGEWQHRNNHTKIERLSYQLLEQIGPDHHKTFVSQVKLGDKPIGEGRGPSKKASEQEAAKEGLQHLREELNRE
jgi:ribonuclease-3